jgi:hypothetical protein
MGRKPWTMRLTVEECPVQLSIKGLARDGVLEFDYPGSSSYSAILDDVEIARSTFRPRHSGRLSRMCRVRVRPFTYAVVDVLGRAGAFGSPVSAGGVLGFFTFHPERPNSVAASATTSPTGAAREANRTAGSARGASKQRRLHGRGFGHRALDL